MKTKLALLFALLVTHFFTAASAGEVVIPDAALKSAIWAALGKPGPVGVLTEQDMLSLTLLDASYQGVESLEGLGTAQNLTELNLIGNGLMNLILPELTSLTSLELSDNQLTNLTLPDGLTNLTALEISGYPGRPNNRLTSLTLPHGLTSLTMLNLSFSTSGEFTLDGDVSHLTSFYCNGVTEMGLGGPLAKLTLPAGLTSLTNLYLALNQLTNLTLPAGLTSLATLDLSYNQLADFSFLTGLTNLTLLDVGGNQLTSLTLPAGLTNLTSLFLYENQLTSLTLPVGLTSLTRLDLHGNQLKSLTLPVGLTNLTTLDLFNNPLRTLVLPQQLADAITAGTLAYYVDAQVSIVVYLPGLVLTAIQPSDTGIFEFLLTGPPGHYTIQATEGLSTWTNLDPVTIDANGSVKVTDASANARPHSFYRAIQAN